MFNPINMQVALILDEMDPNVLKKVEENKDSPEGIKQAIRNTDFSGYFSKEKNPEKQRKMTARAIFSFFEDRKNDK